MWENSKANMQRTIARFLPKVQNKINSKLKERKEMSRQICIVNEALLDKSGQILAEVSWKKFTARLREVKAGRKSLKEALLKTRHDKEISDRYLVMYFYESGKMLPDGTKVLAERNLIEVYKRLLRAKLVVGEPTPWKEIIFN